MTPTVDTLRRQLLQLEELHASGALIGTHYEESRAALERTLIEMTLRGNTAPAGAALGRPSTALLAALASSVIALAAAGYWWTRMPPRAGADAPSAKSAPMGMGSTGMGMGMQAPAAAASAAPHPMGSDQIAAMVDRLAQRLKDKPGDAEGWAMLARSYSVLARYDEAVPAYANAMALRGDDPTLLADYADALASKDHHGLQGEPMKLVDRALALDPANVKALSLAGTEAFDRKDYAQALKRWQRVVELGPADSALVQQAKSAIEQARAMEKTPGAPTRAASK